MGPHERFMMRGTNDHAICMGQGSVQGIVIVKGPAPHGRPQVIAFHSQDQLEHMGIKRMIE